MIKISAMVLVVLVVVGIGGGTYITSYGFSGNSGSRPPQQTAKEKADKLWVKFLATESEEWKTFYSPDYKFSLNYPSSNNSTIADIKSSGSLLAKQFNIPTLNFVIIVKPSTIDPQGYTVQYSQNLPSYYDLFEGGKVTPIVEDGVVGYLLRTINEQNGSWNYIINFSNNGYLYSFMFSSPFNESDMKKVESMIDSIKFFD